MISPKAEKTSYSFPTMFSRWSLSLKPSWRSSLCALKTISAILGTNSISSLSSPPSSILSSQWWSRKKVAAPTPGPLNWWECSESCVYPDCWNSWNHSKGCNDLSLPLFFPCLPWWTRPVYWFWSSSSFQSWAASYLEKSLTLRMEKPCICTRIKWLAINVTSTSRTSRTRSSPY